MFSVVLPATGEHAWDITEGWVEALRQLNQLRNVFRPKSNWGDLGVSNDNGLADYLRSDPDEYFLLLGFDWHSQPLHQGEIYELLLKRKAANIAVIWEDYNISNEVIPDLKQNMVSAWQKASLAVGLTVTNHESNLDVLASLPQHCRIEYLGFGVDLSNYHHRKIPAQQKNNTIYFSGKLNVWEDVPGGGPYALRRQLSSFLVDNIDNLVIQDGNVSDSEYRASLCRSKACLNLPSFTTSPTLRCYEALAAGSLLLTWKLPSSATEQELSSFPSVFYYDPQDPHDLLNKCRLVSAINANRQRNIIAATSSRAVETFSHEARIRALVRMLESDSADAVLPQPSVERLLVVDCVFFQIATNGIAYVWDSIIRTYIQQYGSDSIVLIRRSDNLPSGYGCRVIDAEPISWESPPPHVAHQIDLLLAENDITDCCFASTYYTTSSQHRTITVIHDMIPEILSGDEAEWAHKQFSMETSQAIICVSLTTHWDLRGYSWQLASKSVVCENGLPLAHFRSEFDQHPPLSAEQIQVIQSDFSVLYIGGRYGWKGYKNGGTLIRAFRIFWNQVKDFANVKLVFVSHYPEPEEQISALIEGLPVLFITATDAELCDIRRLCQCLVHPSLIEGFGLPIIEGLYGGSSVIASSIAPHKEASMSYDVDYFPPVDDRALADCLIRSFERSRSDLAHADPGRLASEIEAISIHRWRKFASCLHAFAISESAVPFARLNKSDAMKRPIAARSLELKRAALLANLQTAWDRNT